MSRRSGGDRTTGLCSSINVTPRRDGTRWYGAGHGDDPPEAVEGGGLWGRMNWWRKLGEVDFRRPNGLIS